MSRRRREACSFHHHPDFQKQITWMGTTRNVSDFCSICFFISSERRYCTMLYTASSQQWSIISDLSTYGATTLFAQLNSLLPNTYASRPCRFKTVEVEEFLKKNELRFFSPSFALPKQNDCGHSVVLRKKFYSFISNAVHYRLIEVMNWVGNATKDTLVQTTRN